MTTRQRIAVWMRDYEKRSGQPPSTVEIAAAFGISQPAVSRHLRIMAKAGTLHVLPGTWRKYTTFRRTPPDYPAKRRYLTEKRKIR